jgi:hypothetical protein
MANVQLDVILVQSFVLFIAALVIWLVQSYFVLRFARKYVYPTLYKNKLTEWFVAEAAILLHETSHFLSAIFSGSTVELKESYITSRAGRIAAAREESIFGWISSVIAAFSPSVLPPFFFSILLILIAGQQLDISSLFSYSGTLEQTIRDLGMAIQSTLVPVLGMFYSSISHFDVATVFVLYLLVICSIAAGPSEGDWQAAVELFASPLSMLSMLGALVLFNFLFAQFNIGFFTPAIVILLFFLVIVVTGVLVAFVLSRILDQIFRLAA